MIEAAVHKLGRNGFREREPRRTAGLRPPVNKLGFAASLGSDFMQAEEIVSEADYK